MSRKRIGSLLLVAVAAVGGICCDLTAKGNDRLFLDPSTGERSNGPGVEGGPAGGAGAVPPTRERPRQK
jgi:hypothetical protein